MRKSILLMFASILALARTLWAFGLTGSPEVVRHAIVAYVDQNNTSGVWLLKLHKVYSLGGVVDTNYVVVDSMASFPHIFQAGSGGNLYLTYVRDTADASYHAYIKIKRSTDVGATWSNYKSVTQDSSIARDLNGFWDADTLFLIWEDCRNGEWHTYYRNVFAP